MGERKTIEIPLAIKDLGYYDENKREFVVESGIFEIQVGASSTDIGRKFIFHYCIV